MLTAFYDLHCSPASYDVVAFLLVAENWRLGRGAERIRIEILPGPWAGFRRDGHWPQDVEMRKQMRDRVVVPMCRMLPTADVVVRHDRPANHREADNCNSLGFKSPRYGLRNQVEMLRHGIRPLRAPDIGNGRAQAFLGKKMVTITLREAEHWPGRNSNVPAWLDAAADLERRGYDVVVIRDTHRVFEALPGWPAHSLEAALHLDWRALLYSAAVCNLGVSNGPMWFALALDAPVLMLRPTTDRANHTATDAYFRGCGIEPGGQIPGSPAHQRLAWAEDTTENILAAFDEFMAAQQPAVAA
jgi:hypothetical protein